MPIAITSAQARDVLRTHGHDPQDLSPIRGGLWSAAFTFDEGGRAYVVRFHDRRDDLEKDRFAQRWEETRLRTPRVVEIGESEHGAYGISERVTGEPIDELDDPGFRAVLPALLRALDGTREADLRGTSGYGLWHGDGNGAYASWHDALLFQGGGPGGLAERRGRLAATPIGTREFDTGVARLRSLLPSRTEERHLVHNDLLYRNVLADERGVVLLDWGASIYGDFLYDAALLTFWWPWFPQWRGIDIRAEIVRHYAAIDLRIPSFAERLRCCELSIGVDHIAFQAGYERWDDAAWTARRTLALAEAPL